MKITISIIALTILSQLTACSNKDKTTSIDNATKDEHIKPDISYAPSTIVDKTDMVIYPLYLKAGNYNNYSRNTGNNYWNIIFNNVISGESWLLTRKKLIINNFKIENSKFANALSSQFIYYEITDYDTDGDKKLTPKDGIRLYLSNLEGKVFTPVSPANYSVYSWKMDHRHDLILMDLIKDSNGDRKFDEKDETAHLVYNLKTGMPAKPVFDEAFNKELKAFAEMTL